ncbi:gluconate 2-dehydrogenase subunit 3 family protein [Panacibacter sp. DH6]|uniref:Gluconate 2-dehydrogenase subunit 3 family protein n=1 Tax=Panacibacter microcysteis TaxID=2793269 RepID=A0A931GZM4_9BACT|nr:gluconate 2-dehydrogenase subunit 3 family protein [Panacibacter microcysteis]MBG9378302.1 gluconate 2-dehydrogenase subunit 3 family protein [Panacibacter microcysteis]
MDRRKSLKAIAVGTVATGVLVDACKSDDKDLKGKADSPAEAKKDGYNRMAEEQVHEDAIKNAPKFFTDAEMATITLLGDIIIPKDDISGSASDAKVPEFIEFIVKDMPQHQVPMRGGLRWLDLKCIELYGKAFTDCTKEQQMEMVDAIAYPKKAKPEMSQGVSFFNLMRNLTATGFYTSEIGVKDVGYVGNTPNKWNGVPDDVLKQYGYAYTEKEMKECASY